jgi:UDP-glucose 4-epimerase
VKSQSICKVLGRAEAEFANLILAKLKSRYRKGNICTFQAVAEVSSPLSNDEIGPSRVFIVQSPFIQKLRIISCFVFSNQPDRSNTHKMKALITGGAGFVGSHLADALIREGHLVTVLDDLSTGSMSNIQHLKGDSNFSYVIESMMEKSLLAELVDQADVIFHLAAAVGVRLIVESPVRTIETNVQATELLLKLAAKKRKKVLLTSTSEVYGKSQKIPFNENGDLVMGPTVRGRWSYACSKAIDEFLAIAYHKEKDLPVVVVRLFNTVGPRQTGTYGMVLPRFVHQALTRQPITIYGDGEQTRCFGYVGDVVQALIALVKLPEAEGQVYNIGSDEEVSILKLAETVRQVTNSDSKIEFRTYADVYGDDFEDMNRRVPDLSKIRAAIGYETTKDLRGIITSVQDHLLEKLTTEMELRASAG